MLGGGRRGTGSVVCLFVSLTERKDDPKSINMLVVGCVNKHEFFLKSDFPLKAIEKK